MLKKLLFSVFTFVLITLPFSWTSADEAMQITMLKVAIRNDYFIVYWKTNFESMGTINFGLTNGFGSSVTDRNLTKAHETTIAGILPKKKYYFQLRAFNDAGTVVNSSVYQIETADSSDSDPPTIINVSASYVTGNYAQITWQTNEDASGCVKVGPAYDNLKRSVCDGGIKKVFDIFVDKLSSGTQYIFQIVAKDKKGNQQYSTYYRFSTVSRNDGTIGDLEIVEMTTDVGVDDNNQTKVALRILINHPADGRVYVGEQTGKYKWHYDLNKPRSVNQLLLIPELQPDRDYFYKVELTDVYKKKITTPEFRFRTWPRQNLIVVEDNNAKDSDSDGLSDADENIYGTNSLLPDSDNDGYLDGVEVKNGYNPLGPGRLNQTNIGSTGNDNKIFAYGQKRKDTKIETLKAKELKAKLVVKFGGKIPVSSQGWPTLVNAYVYGGYPVEAIYKSIIFGGKTVHPTIIWEKWRQSSDYKNYINKERVTTNNKLKYK